MARNPASDRRHNQKERTRRAVIAAARDMLADSTPLTMELVAERALISRATIYRYFPNLDALMLEIELDGHMPTINQFQSDYGDEFDIRNVVDGMFNFYSNNEENFRRFLSATLIAGSDRAKPSMGHANRYRSVRRTELIDAALAGTEADREDVKAQLGVVLGPELFISCLDACGLSHEDARKIIHDICEAIVSRKS